MDIELTPMTAMPPNSDPLIVTSSESTKSPPSASAPLSMTLATHQMHSACRFYQPKMTTRRRCRSECLQMAPTSIPSLDSCLEHLNELRQKLNIENTINETDDSNVTNFVSGEGMFSIIDSFRGSDGHNENIKENISADSTINELNNGITDDSKVLDDDLKNKGDDTDFCSDEFNNLSTDQALIDNQTILLKMNEEIDKKYFDILKSARNDYDQGDTVSGKMAPDGDLQTNDHDAKPATENRRRVRARSESDPHEIYQLEISSSLAAYKCAGDDVSFISKY